MFIISRHDYCNSYYVAYLTSKEAAKLDRNLLKSNGGGGGGDKVMPPTKPQKSVKFKEVH